MHKGSKVEIYMELRAYQRGERGTIKKGMWCPGVISCYLPEFENVTVHYVPGNGRQYYHKIPTDWLTDPERMRPYQDEEQTLEEYSKEQKRTLKEMFLKVFKAKLEAATDSEKDAILIEQSRTLRQRTEQIAEQIAKSKKKHTTRFTDPERMYQDVQQTLKEMKFGKASNPEGDDTSTFEKVGSDQHAANESLTQNPVKGEKSYETKEPELDSEEIIKENRTLRQRTEQFTHWLQREQFTHWLQRMREIADDETQSVDDDEQSNPSIVTERGQEVTERRGQEVLGLYNVL